MNQRIAKIGSLVVAVTVIIFAVCMLIPFNFGSYFICMILLVYFAQTTVVQQGNLNEQAMEILDFQRGGLIFNYDLLGYGIMALSTFFAGTTIVEKRKSDKVLKWLMIIHGIFFIGCFILPMTGVFSNMSDSGSGIGGVIALEFWCAYFLPVGILSYMHFCDRKM